GLPAAGRGVRDRRGGGGVRPARGVLLPQVPLHAAALPEHSGLPGPREPGTRFEAAAARARRRLAAPLQGLHRARLPAPAGSGDGAGPAAGGHQTAARGAPAPAAALRLDAPRAVPEEHRPVLPGGAAGPAGPVGRSVGGPLVAREAADAAPGGSRGSERVLI